MYFYYYYAIIFYVLPIVIYLAICHQIFIIFQPIIYKKMRQFIGVQIAHNLFPFLFQLIISTCSFQIFKSVRFHKVMLGFILHNVNANKKNIWILSISYLNHINFFIFLFFKPIFVLFFPFSSQNKYKNGETALSYTWYKIKIRPNPQIKPLQLIINALLTYLIK